MALTKKQVEKIGWQIAQGATVFLFEGDRAYRVIDLGNKWMTVAEYGEMNLKDVEPDQFKVVTAMFNANGE